MSAQLCEHGHHVAEPSACGPCLLTANAGLKAVLAEAERRVALITKDRDEWMQSTMDANTRFKQAEYKLRVLAEERLKVTMASKEDLWAKANAIHGGRHAHPCRFCEGIVTAIETERYVAASALEAADKLGEVVLGEQRVHLNSPPCWCPLSHQACARLNAALRAFHDLRPLPIEAGEAE